MNRELPVAALIATAVSIGGSRRAAAPAETILRSTVRAKAVLGAKTVEFTSSGCLKTGSAAMHSAHNARGERASAEFHDGRPRPAETVATGISWVAVETAESRPGTARRADGADAAQLHTPTMRCGR